MKKKKIFCSGVEKSVRDEFVNATSSKVKKVSAKWEKILVEMHEHPNSKKLEAMLEN